MDACRWWGPGSWTHPRGCSRSVWVRGGVPWGAAPLLPTGARCCSEPDVWLPAPPAWRAPPPRLHSLRPQHSTLSRRHCLLQVGTDGARTEPALGLVCAHARAPGVRIPASCPESLITGPCCFLTPGALPLWVPVGLCCLTSCPARGDVSWHEVDSSEHWGAHHTVGAS